MKRIGLLGGTFDPIHYGHLNVAWQSLQKLGLEQVWFIPNHLPPHRNMPQATAIQRLTMIELAIAAIPEFSISRVEIDNDQTSYSVETLITLNKLHPSAEFYWLLGNDSFSSLPTWHHWQEICQYARIIILNRPEHPLIISAELQHWFDHHHDKIETVDIPELKISSTYIKQQLQNQQLPRFLLPDSVLDYCQQLQLYQPVQLYHPAKT